MYEWLLTLGGAVLVYAGGVATKPLQAIIDDRRVRKQLKKALYAELSANYNQLLKLRMFLQNFNEPQISVGHFVEGYINVDCFDYAKKNPLPFNSIPEANNLKTLYSGFTLIIQNSAEKSRAELMRACDAQLDALRERLLLKLLDKNLFLKGIGPEYQKYFDLLVTAERLPPPRQP
jgi:hypothetical protein